MKMIPIIMTTSWLQILNPGIAAHALLTKANSATTMNTSLKTKKTSKAMITTKRTKVIFPSMMIYTQIPGRM